MVIIYNLTIHYTILNQFIYTINYKSYCIHQQKKLTSKGDNSDDDYYKAFILNSNSGYICNGFSTKIYNIKIGMIFYFTLFFLHSLSNKKRNNIYRRDLTVN